MSGGAASVSFRASVDERERLSLTGYPRNPSERGAVIAIPEYLVILVDNGVDRGFRILVGARVVMRQERLLGDERVSA